MTPKEQLNVWKNTDPELRKLAEQIPNLKDCPQAVEASEKLQQLKAASRELQQQVSGFYHGDSVGEVRRTDAVADAVKLLAGEPLEGESRDTEYQNLVRLMRATEKAVELQQQRVTELRLQLPREACGEGQPAERATVLNAKKLYEIYKELLKELRVKAVLQRNILPSKGFANRPDCWSIKPLEDALLFGGAGLPRLEIFIEQMEKDFGFGDKKRKVG